MGRKNIPNIASLFVFYVVVIYVLYAFFMTGKLFENTMKLGFLETIIQYYVRKWISGSGSLIIIIAA